MTLKIRDLSVEMRDLTSLSLHARNARTHSKQQIEQIASSIRTFGWTNPVLTDGNKNIIAGHGRVEAARLLGIDRVPVIELTDLSEAQKRAYVIADNKLAEQAGWDSDLLRLELIDLNAMDLDFSLDVIGFETGELDLLLNEDSNEPEPDTPIMVAGPPVSESGDIWILGDHILLCGDALSESSYEALLGEELAAAMFTDPPYNVPVNGHVCGLGRVRHEEFLMASGEMTAAEFRNFLMTFCQRAEGNLKPGAIAYVCMDWRHIEDLLHVGRECLGELLQFCVWNKMQGGMGSLYRSQHELVPVFRTHGGRHRNNVELGRHGRNRTNVWDFTGVQARREELKLHPTVKPVPMVAEAIMDVTARGELVLDPFSGSGSTILAAERTGRRARCLELDPRYVDVAVRRFQEVTGKRAVHALWDQRFDEIAEEKADVADA